MLLDFSVTNYKVFKETAQLNLSASNYDKATHEQSNVYVDQDKSLRILRSAVVYGANASGKTKLFESLAFLKRFVLESSKESQQGTTIDIQPFLLSETTKEAPTELEIVFLHAGSVYRYGFEVTRTAVLAEWLFMKPKSHEIQIFYRDTVENTLETHAKLFRKGSLLQEENLVRSNALMLSVAAQFNDELCSKVVTWFAEQLTVVSSIAEDRYKGYTMMKNDQEHFHQKLMHLMNVADFSIQDIRSKVLEPESLSEDMPAEIKERILHMLVHEHAKIYDTCETIHHVYDQHNHIAGSTNFSLDKDESHGTQRFFYLAGPILDTLEYGKTLFIDEFDARLHPILVLQLFSLFNNPAINTKGAQLVITTQNSILLQSGVLRKDQIWFVEKDRFEAAHLYSLADFKSTLARKRDNYEDNYLRGKYGAIPSVNLAQSFGEEAGERESTWPAEK
ncbi:hypothetical protein SDC9_60505 [bioreactor metagenome]|uniref:ATPase AAA-type core domain-containing protein n=1 Tax=bioreactor metagenome TaxID=1076179 RepID=A0A644XD69_9ZZZZ